MFVHWVRAGQLVDTFLRASLAGYHLGLSSLAKRLIFAYSYMD